MRGNALKRVAQLARLLLQVRCVVAPKVLYLPETVTAEVKPAMVMWVSKRWKKSEAM
jgi:hypothetical protein